MRVITIEGPGKNALSTPVMTRLRSDLVDAAGEPVLLRGAGDAFSAGLNLKEVVSLDKAGMEAFLDLLEDVVGLLYHRADPTVAWIGGHAIAGGCVLALACDRRIALEHPKIRIGLNEVALGLQFPPRTLTIVRRQIPTRFEQRILLGAALVDPVEAQAVGLVDALGDERAAQDVLEQLAKHPRAAFSATKAILRPPTAVDPATRMHYLERVVPAWTSDEGKARLAAALAR